MDAMESLVMHRSLLYKYESSYSRVQLDSATRQIAAGDVFTEDSIKPQAVVV